MTDISMDYDPEDGYPPDEEEVLGHELTPLGTQRGPERAGGKRMMVMERQRRALELRKSGATYAAIAAALGYADHTSARAAVLRAMDRVIQEPAEELKMLQIERLNHMLLPLWPKVQGGDERAIDSALRIMDKLDRLMGTEAAQRVEIDQNVKTAVLVVDGNKEDFINSMMRMAQVNPEDVPQGELPTGAAAAAPVNFDDIGIVDAEVISDSEDVIAPKKKSPRPRMKSMKANNQQGEE